MAKTASIPITDHNDGITCTVRYGIRYRLTGAPTWISAEDQFDTPVTIPNLDASTDYDYEITRYCCDGLVSTAATGSFTTSA